MQYSCVLSLSLCLCFWIMFIRFDVVQTIIRTAERAAAFDFLHELSIGTIRPFSPSNAERANTAYEG